MNALLLPLSRVAFRPDHGLAPVLVGPVVHVVRVGDPIAYMVRGAAWTSRARPARAQR